MGGGVREPALGLDETLAVITANDPFYRTFRLGPKATEGTPIYELAKGQWDLPELRRLLEEVLPQEQVLKDFRIEADFGRAGRRVLMLNARQLQRAVGLPAMIVLTMEEITDNTT